MEARRWADKRILRLGWKRRICTICEIYIRDFVYTTALYWKFEEVLGSGGNEVNDDDFDF